jgi:hypothetical protein
MAAPAAISIFIALTPIALPVSIFVWHFLSRTFRASDFEHTAGYNASVSIKTGGGTGSAAGIQPDRKE